MREQSRFLVVLWSFVLVSFALFQNFTQDVTPNAVHNDSCKQALDLNQSRISNLNNIHADLLAVWPSNAPDIQSSISVLSLSLLETNKQIYTGCVADVSVRDSHTLALAEMRKLSDSSSNAVWKKYVDVLNAVHTKIGESK